MQDRVARAERTIAVLYEAYLKSVFGRRSGKWPGVLILPVPTGSLCRYGLRKVLGRVR
jgi:hypothetical protein